MDPTRRISEALNDSTGFHVDVVAPLGVWDTRQHHVELLDTLQFGRVLRIDGHNFASERDAFVRHENLVHPALTAHLAPRRVLLLGGGDGGALREILKHPSVEQVVHCQPDAELEGIAREHLAAVHRGAFDNPRVRVLRTDMIRFLRETQDRFDLIVVDLASCDPADAHCATDVLQRCRIALLPGGALALHLGAPAARPERVAEIAQRLNGIFRIVRPYTVYAPLQGTQWAMAVCSDKLDPKAITADEIDRRIDHRKIQDLRFYNGETHEGVFALPNFLRDLVTPPRVKQQSRGRRLGVVQAAVK